MNSHAAECPDENLLSSWAVGACSPDETATLAAHIEGCEACRTVVADVISAVRLSTQPAPPALFSSTPPVAPGEVLLGKYEVQRLLGSGGMGVVMLARHLQLNTNVALKFIRTELTHDPEVVSRFAREARAASRLNSPYVNRVIDLGALPNGTPFMAMEYLEGQSLAMHLENHGPMSKAQTIGLTRQMLAGLGEAHGLGIVHRDLKPANLFLRRLEGGTDRLTILDFGIAKSVHPDIEAGLQATSNSRLVGSPAYMAPEQLLLGASVDARADVWAVGCTMFTMLTGAPPFSGSDFIDLAWRVRNAPLPTLPEHVGAELIACVEKCLAKDPAHRFQTVQALDEVLVQALAVTARPSVKWPWALGAAIVVAVLIGAAWRVSKAQPLAESIVRVEPKAELPVVRPAPAQPVLEPAPVVAPAPVKKPSPPRVVQAVVRVDAGVLELQPSVFEDRL